jgi:hypothetical protein
MIFMVYPSDTEAMSVRSHTQVIRVSIFLLTIYIFLLYRQAPSRHLLLSFFITMYFTVTSTEYAFVLILAFPILLVYFEKPLTYRFFNLSLIWYIFPIWYIGYYILISFYSKPYGSRYISNVISGEEILNILESIVRFIYVFVFENWLATFPPLTSPVYTLITLFLMSIMVLAGYRLVSDEQVNKIKPILLYMIVGLFIIILSSVIFSIIPKFRTSDWRVYGFGSIGATIVVLSFLRLLINKVFSKRHDKLIFFSVSIILFGLAFNHSIHQYEKYWNIAQTTAGFLDSISDYENISPHTRRVFLTNMTSDELDGKLGYLSHDRVWNVALQVSSQESSISWNKTPICYLVLGNCKFHTKRMTYKTPYRLEKHISYDHIVFFWIESDLSVRLLETLPDEPWQLSYAQNLYQPYENVQLRTD